MKPIMLVQVTDGSYRSTSFENSKFQNSIQCCIIRRNIATLSSSINIWSHHTHLFFIGSLVNHWCDFLAIWFPWYCTKCMNRYDPDTTRRAEERMAKRKKYIESKRRRQRDARWSSIESVAFESSSTELTRMSWDPKKVRFQLDKMNGRSFSSTLIVPRLLAVSGNNAV